MGRLPSRSTLVPSRSTVRLMLLLRPRLCSTAAAAFQKAQEVCKAETAAAQKTAEDARAAEAPLAQAAQTEQGTASHLSSLQASAMPPVYNSGYTGRSYGYC